MPRLFGAKLKYIREHFSLTQADLSRQLSVSRAYINNIEASRRGPTLNFVRRLAGTLAVSTDYLLRDTIPVEDVSRLSALLPAHLQSSSQLPPLFGLKLRHLRTRDRVTQTELVRQLGLRSQSHISLLEAGQNEPSIEMVVQLADRFGVTTDYLLRDALPIQVRDNELDPEAS